MNFKIDVATGIIHIGDFIISSQMKINDFKKFDESVVHVNDYGNGRAVVRFVEPVESNSVKAGCKIEIIESLNLFKVNIFPKSSERDILSSSKCFLTGIIDKAYITENDTPVLVSFPWGYISARYSPDIHYGIDGGDINIDYMRT